MCALNQFDNPKGILGITVLVQRNIASSFGCKVFCVVSGLIFRVRNERRKGLVGYFVVVVLRS